MIWPNETAPAEACFSETLRDLGWYLLVCSGWVLFLYAFALAFFCLRALVLWYYNNYCVGRATEFDIFAPDPLCCPEEEEDEAEA